MADNTAILKSIAVLAFTEDEKCYEVILTEEQKQTLMPIINSVANGMVVNGDKPLSLELISNPQYKPDNG